MAESSKYANTCFDAIGAAATGVKIAGEATTAAVKDAKSALRVVKDGESGFVEGVSNHNNNLKVITDIINKNGLTIDEFNELRLTNPSELSSE